MTRHPLIVVYFCLLAIITIIYLRPDPELRLEAELSRLPSREALDRLQAHAGSTSLNQNMALSLTELALQAGKFPLAAMALEDLERAGAPAAMVQDKWAELEISRGNLPQAARALAAAEELDPNPERRRNLLRIYRTLDQPEAELALLQSLDPIEMPASEKSRLAQLLVQRRDFSALEDLLRSRSGSPHAESSEDRAQLLDLLIDDGRQDEAIVFLTEWIRVDAGQLDVLMMAIPRLIERGLVDHAYQLALRALSDAPETAHVLIPAFARSGHGARFRHLQTLWLSSGTPLSPSGWDTLVDLAEMTGDLRALRTALLQHEPPEPETSGRALLQFLRYQGARSLATYHRLMTPEVLAAAPLVAAAWSSEQRQVPEAMTHLSRAAGTEMTEWDRQIWMLVANDLRSSGAYRELLATSLKDDALQARLRESISPAVPASQRP